MSDYFKYIEVSGTLLISGNIVNGISYDDIISNKKIIKDTEGYTLRTDINGQRAWVKSEVSEDIYKTGTFANNIYSSEPYFKSEEDYYSNNNPQ